MGNFEQEMFGIAMTAIGALVIIFIVEALYRVWELFKRRK